MTSLFLYPESTSIVRGPRNTPDSVYIYNGHNGIVKIYLNMNNFI
ncbi:unnamed protein product, partial [Vitis vinifera]|uniref:Uncharacterized protein n=1 Tax=Vitis vinifera TaxID=29760 RepID=D7SR13_VITVI